MAKRKAIKWMETAFRQCFLSQYVCGEQKLTYMLGGGKFLREKACVILSATHPDRGLFPSTKKGAVSLLVSSLELRYCDDFRPRANGG
jgi:hypothetical protein